LPAKRFEAALYDSQALRSFAGIELNRDPVPDPITVLHFRDWLEVHKLTEALFAEVAALLAEHGLLLRQGTIPAFVRPTRRSSALRFDQNKQKSRDPEMHQTKKSNQWYFGVKAHIGTDLVSGIRNGGMRREASFSAGLLAHTKIRAATVAGSGKCLRNRPRDRSPPAPHRRQKR
jgi:IS5 family transposase